MTAQEIAGRLCQEFPGKSLTYTVTVWVWDDGTGRVTIKLDDLMGSGGSHEGRDLEDCIDRLHQAIARNAAPMLAKIEVPT